MKTLFKIIFLFGFFFSYSFSFAETKTWGLNTSLNYILSSSTLIEIDNSLGQLKQILYPTLVGSYDTPNIPFEIVISSDENTAYIADYDSGLQIIDISSPNFPTLIGSFDTPANARGITLSQDENTVYIADESGGLQILDISTPSTPVIIGNYNTPAFARTVKISQDGNTAYVADGGSGLQIIDIATPSAPTLIGNYNTSGSASDVHISADGDTAFIADLGDGLKIIDISTPSTPILIGSYDTPGSALKLFLSSDETTTYLADDSAGLQIIDITTPTLPTLIATYDTSGFVKDVYTSIDGKTAFVADGNAGLKIIDISSPSSPILIGTYDSVTVLLGVVASSDPDIVYVIDVGVNNLHILDISTFAYPTNSPYISINTAQTFSEAVKSFSETQVGNATGTITYQVSTDNGITWLYWNGTNWVTTIQTDGSETSTAIELNSHIATLDIDGGDFLWRAYLNSDGNQEVELDAITITFDDITAPKTPTVDKVKAGDVTITGTAEEGSIISLSIGNCTNSPVITNAGNWSCDLSISDAPENGDLIVITSTDNAGNFSTKNYSISNSNNGRSSRIYACKDKKAINYSKFGTHKASKCEYDDDKAITREKDPLESNPFGGEICAPELILTQQMKYGDTNGIFSSYNKGVIAEVSLLQKHINRILAEDYSQAAGPIDIWFREKTKQGVKRLQLKLNQLLEGQITPLTIDGIVGPFTKAAINRSC
jgi:hypothetical protein